MAITVRRNFPIRIILALVVAGVGLVTYFARTSVNPVTGEKQHISLTTEQEITLGLNAAPEMAQRMGGVVDPAHPDAVLVRSIGERLVRSSDAARSPYRFDFHLLNDPRTINAFALPGGQVFITRGLLGRLETEAQLAGVLAHEIGHVVHRHGAEHLSKAELAQSLSTAVAVGASDRRDGRAAYAISQVVSQMMQLRYGRKDELESDGYGLKAMTSAGYDPSAMLGVMGILSKASSHGQPEFLSSHPHPESRIAAIEEWIRANFPSGIPANLSQGRHLLRAD